jgi:hypothetical protein
MSFRIFAIIVLGVIAASALTILVASQIAIYLDGPAFIGLAGFVIVALVASLLLHKRNG